MDFDFDQWVHIYATDLPEAEFRRSLVLQEELKLVPPEYQHQCAGLIARLNAIHVTCPPLVALAKNFEMVAERVEAVSGLYSTILDKQLQVHQQHFARLKELTG